MTVLSGGVPFRGFNPMQAVRRVAPLIVRPDNGAALSTAVEPRRLSLRSPCCMSFDFVVPTVAAALKFCDTAKEE
jgi:hypothetical protein